jgi:ABC-type cobalamin/Fe3+-siderophores transport system ATPase subunit
MPGRDQGTDLRLIKSDTGALVVQVKHYVGTGWPGLLSQLRREEAPKIRTLAPPKYGLATSVPLSPNRKNEIMELFQPYIPDPGFVWGQADLNGLLRDHPEVERAHFKLWLSSTTVLDAIIHAGATGRAELVLEDIREKTSLFVETDRLPAAQRVLSEHRVCIISGPPGVGKTTLAQMLLADLLGQGFELVVVSGDIDEAFESYKAYKPQVFFYDDFLGSTTAAEAFSKNEDSRLAQFIQRIRKSKDKYLILTTREYLLADAVQGSERIHDIDISLLKSVLQFSDYGRVQRAYILYNHIYFSGLSSQARASLTEDDKYFTIIDSPSYSPRLVQHIVESAKANDADGPGFSKFAIGILRDPTRIWSQAFAQQLSPIARSFLLTLATLPPFVSVDDFVRIARSQLLGDVGPVDATIIDRAVKSLDGTFFRSSARRGFRVVNFHDPSVRDFLTEFLRTHPDEIARMANSTTTFEQAEFLFSLAKQCNAGASLLEIASRAMRRSFARPGVSRHMSAAGRWAGVPLKLAESYERRFIVALAAARGLREPDSTWLSGACAFLEGRWKEGEGDKHDALALWRARGSLLKEVRDWLGRSEQVLVDWFMGDLDSADAFIQAQELLCELDIGRHDLAVAFDEFIRGELDSIPSLTYGPDMLDRWEALRHACGEFGIDVDEDDRFPIVGDEINRIYEARDSNADYEYERYREDSWEQRAEESEIRSLFQGL